MYLSVAVATRSFLIWLCAMRLRSTILRLPCTTYADFSVFKENMVLKGHVIRKDAELDDVACMVKCVEHPKCRSYNINRELLKCELNSKALGDLQVVLTSEPGWLYKSTDYNNTLVGVTCSTLKPCQPGILSKDSCSPPFYECLHCKAQHSGLRCDKADCRKTQQGKSYRGPTSKTKSGLTCQRWDSQSPHTHSFSPQNNPSAGLDKNFCRNPGDATQPWCYTTSPNTRWEHCNVPLCAGAAAECLRTTQGKDYRGTTSETKSGLTCQRWDYQTPHTHSYTPERRSNMGLEQNFCRNPDNGISPWCYTTSSNKRWEYCSIPLCAGVEPCLNNPCKNGGSCIDKKTDYECKCTLSYTGKTCEKHDPCATLPCFNGGTCSVVAGTHSCKCATGYTGSHCENDIDDCIGATCQHEATCVDKLNGYDCKCYGGTTGKHCETIIGKSCMDVARKFPSSTSGNYIVNTTSIGGNYSIVQCIMYAGDGWTVALDIKCHSGDLATFKANSAAEINTLIGFRRTDVSNYGMLSSALKELHTLTGFSQIRFWCGIDAATKQINIVTKKNGKGAKVIDFLTSSSTTRPASCDSYDRLSGGNSALGSDCSRWRNGKWWSPALQRKLHYKTMAIEDTHHWSLQFVSGYFDCDTFERTTVAQGDFWLVFVR